MEEDLGCTIEAPPETRIPPLLHRMERVMNIVSTAADIANTAADRLAGAIPENSIEAQIAAPSNGQFDEFEALIERLEYRVDRMIDAVNRFKHI